MADDPRHRELGIVLRRRISLTQGIELISITGLSHAAVRAVFIGHGHRLAPKTYNSNVDREDGNYPYNSQSNLHGTQHDTKPKH